MKVQELKIGQGDEDRDFVRRFLTFPERMYKGLPVPNNGILERLLKGDRILSEGQEMRFFYVTDEEEKEILGRCVLIRYRDPEMYHFGFFECIDDEETAGLLLRKVESEAERMGAESITGPVNLSFWLGYRFRTRGESSPYFGEPYNLSYYPVLLDKCGYVAKERYNSFSYLASERVDLDKCRKRYERFISEGYEICGLGVIPVEKALKDIHGLFNTLYSSFPAFRTISQEDFMNLFTPMRYIADRDLISLGYKDGVLKGFFIALRDYGTSLEKGLFSKLLGMIRTRLKPSGYVFSYIGVEKGSEGLGQALIYRPLLRLTKENAVVTSSLIREGTASAAYVHSSRIDDRDTSREYALFEKILKNK